MKKISMIIPCFNEQDNILPFYEETLKSYENQKYKLELVFIDDGSKDETLNQLRKLSNDRKCEIKIISFSRNFGKEAAVYAGLKKVTGDYTVIIDVDLQQHPKLTIKMAEILEKENYDCVCYYQEERKEKKLMIKAKSSFYKVMNKMSEVEMKQGASDFRMFKNNVKDAILSMEEYHRFAKGIFSWIGFNTCYLPYTPDERNSGTTKWGFRKLLKYGISGIISFSTIPIRFSTYLGLVLSMFSMIYLVIVLIQKIFFGIALSGYATIVILILLLGGIELFCIGIIGEYIGRTYIEAKNRPIYIIKEEITNEKNKRTL